MNHSRRREHGERRERIFYNSLRIAIVVLNDYENLPFSPLRPLCLEWFVKRKSANDLELL